MLSTICCLDVLHIMIVVCVCVCVCVFMSVCARVGAGHALDPGCGEYRMFPGTHPRPRYITASSLHLPWHVTCIKHFRAAGQPWRHELACVAAVGSSPSACDLLALETHTPGCLWSRKSLLLTPHSGPSSCLPGVSHAKFLFPGARQLVATLLNVSLLVSQPV